MIDSLHQAELERLREQLDTEATNWFDERTEKNAEIERLRAVALGMDTAIADLTAERDAAREDRKEAEAMADKWQEDATYEVGGVPHWWKDRAEAAEAERDRLRDLLSVAAQVMSNLIETHGDGGAGLVLKDIRAALHPSAQEPS